MRTIPAEMNTLIQRLARLDVSAARGALMKSFDAGYEPAHISQILDWYEAAGLKSAEGRVIYPYSPNQLVLRLRDPDGLEVSPAQGNWRGGKSGFWTQLDAKLTKTQDAAKRSQIASAALPERRASQHVPETAKTLLTREEILASLTTHNAPSYVRASANRWVPDAPIPRTLIVWLKSQGLAG